MMDLITAIGFLAATLTTISFVPQAWMVWKTKSTHDISFGMFSILCSGIAAWLVYGLLKNDLPIIIANTITLCLAGSILVAKIKFR